MISTMNVSSEIATNFFPFDMTLLSGPGVSPGERKEMSFRAAHARVTGM